jgi:hypothetical protein
MAGIAFFITNKKDISLLEKNNVTTKKNAQFELSSGDG